MRPRVRSEFSASPAASTASRAVRSAAADSVLSSSRAASLTRSPAARSAAARARSSPANSSWILAASSCPARMAVSRPAATGAWQQCFPRRGFGAETGCGKGLLKLPACLRGAGGGLFKGRLRGVGVLQDRSR